ncbi:hypothetical protein QPK32_08665 [Massilia sp. YIM B02763]|uniref:hypothetical protein n=1 Tax=Massilia sp. YIM B02763 TaxID=3050130 RepID=UPI0025B7355B|nr:hypothetical protein [Massilia sp. YIM B02763]MDN4053149.1 hypothetical protein [Massilia sp. YIM B02763]
MATKKRVKIPARSPDDSQRPESETNVETTRTMNVDTEAERIDSDASPEIGSVEGRGQSSYRVDIEHGGETDAGDVERGGGV